jgi:hypothetical protein
MKNIEQIKQLIKKLTGFCLWGAKGIDIRIPPLAIEHVEKIRKRQNHRDAAQVVQYALAVYDVATENLAEGGVIIFKRSDGQEEEFRLPLP